MADFEYKLDMAGALWEIISPLELTIGENCMPFLSEKPGADIVIRFRLDRPEEGGTLLRERNPRVWQEGDRLRVERSSALANSANSCVWFRKDDPLRVEGCIYPDRTENVRSLDSLLDMSELELILAQMETFGLHSSLVRRAEGDAILFTAPSGTGKSTQAALWEQYAAADTLNGDRSFLRRVNGAWTAYGSPFAGSSGIFRNESAPVRALVVLRQAPENAIRRLPLAEAFRTIYSESVLPRWNDDAHQKIISLITAIVGEVPVYRLDCTPDEGAVRLLRETLEGETK